MQAIPSMPSSCGTGARRLLVRNQSGATPHECAMPKALARKSKKLKKAQIAGGRQVKDSKNAKLKLNLVIDTSGSMMNSFGQTSLSLLEVAKGVAIAWYLEMTNAEQESLTCYRYDRQCTKLTSFSKIQYLRPNGGTRLSSLQPFLDTSSKSDRWLVITDGDLPDFSMVGNDVKLAVVSLDACHTDERVIRFTNDPEDQRKLHTKLKALLR